MARINRVKSARKPQGSCGRCGVAINPGDPYIHWSNRATRAGRGWRRVRCTKQECFPRRSEYMTTSDKLGQLMDAQDDAEAAIDAAETVEDLEAALEDAAGVAHDVGEQYEESASNMEEHFPGSYQVDEIREKSEMAESWAATLESGLDAEIPDKPEAENYDTEEDYDEAVEAYETAVEEARQEARDKVSECELV
jgi:hypothetical protein